MQKLVTALAFIILSFSSTAQVLTLKFTTTADCKLYVDGEYKTTLVTDGIFKVDLRAGDYQVKAVSTSNAADVFKTFYTVNKEDLGMQKIYEIDLQNIIQNRIDNENRIEQERIVAEKQKELAEKAQAEKEEMQKQKQAQTQNEPNSHKPDTINLVNKIIKDMVLVKGGTYQMGCTRDQGNCANDEKPTHSVTISDFYISKYELTQEQWYTIMGTNSSQFTNCESCPVERVSWLETVKFIEKLNEISNTKFRLPTEAEFEYAGRGGQHRENFQFSGSNSIEDIGWTETNSTYKTHPVGQKPPNALGLYDMTGNVFEWCRDDYDDNYYRNSPETNPVCESVLNLKVLRGGSYKTKEIDSHVSSRYSIAEDRMLGNIGFRLASDK